MSDASTSAGKVGLLPILVVALVALALRALFVMLAWNFVMPELFGLKELDYLQAMGLFITSSLLFGALVPSNNSDRLRG